MSTNDQHDEYVDQAATVTANLADHVSFARVEFACPACGAEGYEEDLDVDDIASAVDVSFPCDECPAHISLSVDVSLSAHTPEGATR